MGRYCILICDFCGAVSTPAKTRGEADDEARRLGWRMAIGQPDLCAACREDPEAMAAPPIVRVIQIPYRSDDY